MLENPSVKNSNKVALRPIFYAICLSVGVWMGLNIHTESQDKFSQIFSIIDQDYVDSLKIDQLKHNTITSLLESLDPHSSYIPARLSEYSNRQINGKYEGLGIEYISYLDTLMVYNVFKGGPAEKAGVMPGDRMLMANNVALTDSLNSEDIQDAMLGEVNSALSLKVYRRNTNQILTFNIKRSTITINSSEVYYMVNSTLGYIQIERFSSETHNQFLTALDSLKKLGLRDLILDLRNNGGGLLSEAVAIANEFLPKDRMISFTYGQHRKRHEYIADGMGRFQDGKLVLLVNHNTASASEILAGALQDNDRAVIMGNRTYGKALVQEPFRLNDGSMLRLTIARYYTPSGRSIQKSYGKNIESYRNEIYVRDILKDTLNPILDSSIKKKYFTTNGRILISGGGIRPDVLLRDTMSDSTEVESLMPGLFYSKVFDIYLVDYMSDDLKNIASRYKSVALFHRNYKIDHREIQKLIKIAAQIPYLRNLKYSPKTAAIIDKHLKAALAYRIYGEIGKSQIINEEEDVFSKTFEVLKNYNRILNIGVKKTRSFDY
jgi:carboxyl-terminal processing protease